MPDRSTIFSDKTRILLNSLSLWHSRLYLRAREFTLCKKHKAIVNLLSNAKSKVILQIECLTLRLQGYNFNLKYVKSDENVCNYSNQHSDKDLLKFKELIHHVNFVEDDCTPNNLTIDVIRNSPKMINFYFKL